MRQIGLINPLKTLEVNRFQLRHPRIAPALAGLNIAQITDIHFGPWIKSRHLGELVEYVNGLQPDLVALTGDYVGYNKRALKPCADALGELVAPTYAVLGNHDHWASTDLSVGVFEAVDIPVLRNERALFEWGGGQLDIVGVDDAVTKNADVDKAFRDRDDSSFCLTLNHVPSIAWACADAGAHMILSGHTHGFQFNIPRVTNALAERFGTELFAGPYLLREAMLYISRGLGSASWPRRIRAAPELTFFELESGPRPELELTSSETVTIEGKRR